MKNIFLSYEANDIEVNNIFKNMKELLNIREINIIDCYSYISMGQLPVLELINKCSIFISFLNSYNPQLMFELGYAIAKNKKILIISDPKNIPFEVQNMKYIKRSDNINDILFQIQQYVYSEKEHICIDENMDKNQDIDLKIKKLIMEPFYLDNIEYFEFEDLICDWFLSKGYKLYQARNQNDQGFDFIIETRNGRKVIGEIKKYKQTSQISIAIVRQLLGAMVVSNADAGIIISSAPFTNSAKYFADEIEQKIILMTLTDLLDRKDLAEDIFK